MEDTESALWHEELEKWTRRRRNNATHLIFSGGTFAVLGSKISSPFEMVGAVSLCNLGFDIWLSSLVN